ncbi:SGNH/GDSL hydrolase family protein [Carnobacterium sp.]|uniref:SGNH/GDSL hydrolase family protein n=1 Tax=Carnobacterium sp. TaxID=48221 RepID=UPI0028ADD819|nr:SGNH/GDSL hydrolase family protein [Carnobacterium sp.]
MKKLRSFLLMCVIVALGTFIVIQSLNFFLNKTEQAKKQEQETMDQSVYLVAIGDSLTEGVGDSTQNGGYVPLVANQLRETTGIKEVTTKNYGVSGERSDQILKRIKQQEDVRSDLAKATVIVLTAGGNDLIQTFKREQLKINQDSFIEPKKKYQENLTAILTEFHSLNPKAQVYIFGIYNPYAYLFPEVTEMQEVLDSWNEETEQLAEKEQATYLSLSKLFDLNGQTAPSDTIGGSTDDQPANNPLLYEEDLFHPNDQGYELMADELYQALIKTRKIAD